MHYNTEFEILLIVIKFLKAVLINGITNLIMSAKLATLGLLKITLVWSKGLGIII